MKAIHSIFAGEEATTSAVAVNEEVFVAPASYAQRRLWFLHQLDPGSAAYNMTAAVRLEGHLEFAALERSFNEIVRRHESLRTSFTTIDEELMQVVVAEQPLRIEHIDLGAVPEPERDEAVRRQLMRASEQPFELEQNEALRISLLRLSADEAVLVVVMNHINSDGWSIGVLVREMVVLYEAFRSGESSPLPELEIQYLDYAQWQKDWLTGNVLEEQLGYWQQTLSGRLPVLELPGDVARPGRRTLHGANEELQLPLELSVRLKELSRAHGATLFMTLLAAFQVLLQRYTGLEDLLIGTPVAGRTRPETEALIGFFANTLVIRTEVSSEMRFTALLARVRETALEAQAHADIPFEMLVEELQPERNLSHTPIFQVMFVMQNTPLPELRMTGLRVHLMEVAETRAKFDLTLSMKEKASGLAGTFQYSTDRFTRGRMQRLVGHYQQLLAGIVANPEARVSELPLLTEGERAQLLFDWNDTESVAPEHCLHSFFEEQAARTPERVALVFAEQQLSYAQLNARANQLAHYLRRHGVGPDTPVAICVERSLEMVIGLLGILKAGAAYVPLDPSHPAQRLAFTLSDTQAPVLLTQARLRAQLTAPVARVICLDTEWEAISCESEQNPAVEMSPGNLAYVIYTSGSTGQPKGVLVTHGAISNHMLWMQQAVPLADTDRVLQKTPFTFDASVWEFFLPLMCGAQLVLARPGGHQDSAYLVQTIIERQITVLQLVPPMLRVLLAERNIAQCRSLTRVYCGGEALPYDLQQRFYELLEAAALHNLYGPTEAAVDATYWACQKDDQRALVPIGHPIANTQLYLLDAQLQPVPVGVSAELYIGGGGLGRGYFNRADLTADRFVPNPFGASGVGGARLYRTGDVCRHLCDGAIEYLGRSDHQVKVRGFRIELGEIEAVLTQHDAVQTALVLVREDSSGEQRLVAYVVAADETRTDEVRNYLRERLPSYMIPSAFVSLPALPLLTNGKVDRSALPAPEASGIAEAEYVAPQTPFEIKVASIWADVLELERVGINDNFFDLGGHSLLATRVVSRVNEAYGDTVSLQTLFEKPTLAQFALVVEQTQNPNASTLPPIKTQPRTSPAAENKQMLAPASYAQRRLWFLHQLDPGSAAYNMTAAVRLEGQLEFAALERSFNEIVRRHESLRTSFTTINEELMQVVVAEQPLRIEQIDLSTVPEPERDEAVRRQLMRASEQPFELEQNEALRISLLRLSADEAVLVVVMNHINSDGWSIGVLVREMVVLYEAFRSGESSPLPELEIQYLDYAQWQKDWLTGNVLEEQLGYWQQTLSGRLPVLELPGDVARPGRRTLHGANEELQLPLELSVRLKELSRAHGATLFMTLLAAFQVLLQRYTGLEDLLIGTPVAGRTRPETEALIGFFANTLMIRTEVSSEMRFTALLARVRETALEAQAHADIPFEMLVEELQPERNLSHTPIFQVMFVMQNTPLPELRMTGLRVHLMEVAETRAKFDLTLSMKEKASGLAGTFQYSTDRFTRGRMQRLVGHYQQLLAGIVANPEARVSELPLLTEGERAQLLFDWNDTESVAPEHCLHSFFEEQAVRTPERVALVFAEQQLSYAQLNARANQLAHHLRRHGVGPDTPVAICVERSLEMVIGLLGILKAGAAYVPLDPSHPAQRLAFTLSDTQAPVLLTQARLRAQLTAPVARVICLDTEWEAISCESEQNPAVELSPGNLAYVIYTSGSTGQPKGVLVTHGAISNHMLWMQQAVPLVESDRVLQKTPFTFDASVWEFFLPLMCGAQLVLARPGGHQDSAYLVQTIIERQITVLQLVPPMLRVLLAERNITQCRTLTRVYCGGEALPYDLQQRFYEQLEAAALHNLYGPTEAAVDATYWVCQKDDQRAIVPIGHPIANTQLYLLDAQLQPVPVGVSAELYIGGGGLGRGYFHRADLTADRFIPNPFGASGAGGARLYRTGDVCRHLSDGAIEYLGRSDHQVKVRGFRIELGEIEAVLTQHDAVQTALVLVREDSSGEQRLVAYVVAADETRTDEVRNYLRERLPSYMIPSAFVSLPALPLLTNGKVDRSALPAPEASGIAEAEYVAPQTPFEIKVASIWADVLELERVGINDNFFDLGGHSLLATRVVSRVNEAYGDTVSLQTLFEKPTLAQFALVVEQTQNPNASTLPPIKTQPRRRKNRTRLPANLKQVSVEEVKAILTEIR